jgi:PadR family transcriptional regulator, regulatory protein PadR
MPMPTDRSGRSICSFFKRQAKSYRLTAAGRKQLETELETWDRLSAAIALVLGRAAEVSS